MIYAYKSISIQSVYRSLLFKILEVNLHCCEHKKNGQVDSHSCVEHALVKVVGGVADDVGEESGDDRGDKEAGQVPVQHHVPVDHVATLLEVNTWNICNNNYYYIVIIIIVLLLLSFL